MDANSIADAMRDVHDDLPQSYTPAPLDYTQQLLAQVDRLHEENRSLRQSIQSKDQIIIAKDQMIANLLQHASAGLQAQPPAPPPVNLVTPQAAPVPENQSTASTSKLKVKDPETWSGTKSTLPRFLASCRSKFLIEPHNFPSEFSKIGFAGSCLGGAPADWYYTLFQRYEEANGNGSTPPLEFHSFTAFAQTLSNFYGDPDLKGTMERELVALRQMTSVSNYAAEFQRIAGYLAPGWGDEPLIFHYKWHLKDNIKNALVHEKPYPKTLLDMVAATIRLDLREYEKILDRKASNNSSSSQSSQSRTRQAAPQQSTLAPSLQPRPAPWQTTFTPPTAQTTGPPTTSNDGTTPMELDYVARKVTDAERERRRANNLCNYCGQPGHYASTCPVAPPGGRFPRRINFITEIPDSPDAVVSTNSRAQE
jgi:hypothetical protein